MLRKDKVPPSADHLKRSPLRIAGFAAVGSVGPAGCSGASAAIGGAVAPRPGRLRPECAARSGPGAARCRGSAWPPLLPAVKGRERGVDGSRSNGSIGSAMLLIDSLFQAIGFSLPLYLEILFSPESSSGNLINWVLFFHN